MIDAVDLFQFWPNDAVRFALRIPTRLFEGAWTVTCNRGSRTRLYKAHEVSITINAGGERIMKSSEGRHQGTHRSSFRFAAGKHTISFTL